MSMDWQIHWDLQHCIWFRGSCKTLGHVAKLGSRKPASCSFAVAPGVKAGGARLQKVGDVGCLEQRSDQNGGNGGSSLKAKGV